MLNVVKELGLDTSTVDDIFRDGKVRPSDTDNEGKVRVYHRIMKVKFKNFDDKLTFMKGFKGRMPEGSFAYARHDLTFRQRMEDKALRARLFQLRDDYPEMKKNIVIRDGYIFNKVTNSVFVRPTTESGLGGDLGGNPVGDNPEQGAHLFGGRGAGRGRGRGGGAPRGKRKGRPWSC